MAATSSKTLRRANLLRYYVPIVLFVIVLLYETWEHALIQGRFVIDIHWTSEILFFGILGPTAVYFVLSYSLGLLEKEIEIRSQLEKLNKTLELKVKERTERLAERNEELALVNTELQKLDELKSDFVSLVSHELRGPLTTLNGGIEVALQTEGDLSMETRRTLELMSRESRRLTTFVQTILDVSRLDAGKFNLQLGPVALSPLLSSAIQLVNAGKGRKINYEKRNGLPPVWADETALEKIVCNLLTNAIKYSSNDLPIELEVHSRNGDVLITVSDYGPGISEEKQKRLFTRFERLVSGDRVMTKGWGLGLYFARALAEAQGGELSMRSPIHKSKETPGTSFTISFPVVVEEAND